MVAELEAELEAPPFPLEITHIWVAWTRIRNRKAAGLAGPEPIDWLDLDAFVRLSRQHLGPPDIELIEIIDDAYLASFAAGASPSESNLALRDGLEQVANRGNPELINGHRPTRPRR